MRWSLWFGACVVATFAHQSPRSGPDCQRTPDVGACQAEADLDACLSTYDWFVRVKRTDLGQVDLRTTSERCERAWLRTQREAVAVAGARFALVTHDDAALQRWAHRARATVEGGRIYRFLSDMQRFNGDLESAELSLRRALELQLDRDPARAANTALALLELVLSNEPARESIRLARIAWEQAEKVPMDVMWAYAARDLVDLLVDLGELSTAAAVIERIDAHDPPISQAIRFGAKASLERARGRTRTAIELYRRAAQPDPVDPGGMQPRRDVIGLIQMLVDDGQIRGARDELELVPRRALNKALQSMDSEARLAAAAAAVELAEGNIAGALARVDRALASKPRDAARVELLNVRGDALARRGDRRAAEQAWRAAADSIEAWRDSVPAHQLRSGLIAHHRHALESWLDSTGQRGDAEGAFEVVQRIVGRELLDRIRQRESDAPATTDESVRDVEQRLAAWDRSVALTGPHPRHALRELAHDTVAIMYGARSAWAIRYVRGQWSVDRVGDRTAISVLVDAYRGAIDDPQVAAELGAALFPPDTLPHGPGAAIAVMLDRELSDVALAGLRVGGKYLVEHAAILEVLAPELLFARPPAPPPGRAVAIGAPMSDLPGADDEVRAVARMIDAEAWLGARATSDVIARSAGARLLHIATHSRIADGSAALVLADKVLSAGDIVGKKIAPWLAVIAACRSQVDDDPSGSLVAAFLAAGSPGVIGVKRAYDDADDTQVMREFYGNYQEGRDPLHALALAQRAAIAIGRLPRSWATVSFFGVGGWIP